MEKVVLPQYLLKAVEEHRERMAVSQMGFNDTMTIVLGFVSEKTGLTPAEINEQYTFDGQAFLPKPKELPKE